MVSEYVQGLIDKQDSINRLRSAKMSERKAETFNAKWIEGPKMANASHQFDGQDERLKAEPVTKNFHYYMQDAQPEHEQAVKVFEEQKAQIAETEAAVGEPKLEPQGPWHPPLSTYPGIRQKLDAIRKGLDDLEAAL